MERLRLISSPRTSLASLISLISNLFLNAALIQSMDARLLPAISISSTYRTMRMNSDDERKVYKQGSFWLILNPSPTKNE